MHIDNKQSNGKHTSKRKRSKWAVAFGVIAVVLAKIVKGSPLLIKLFAFHIILHNTPWEWLLVSAGLILAGFILYKVAVFTYRKKVSSRNTGRHL